MPVIFSLQYGFLSLFLSILQLDVLAELARLVHLIVSFEVVIEAEMIADASRPAFDRIRIQVVPWQAFKRVRDTSIAITGQVSLRHLLEVDHLWLFLLRQQLRAVLSQSKPVCQILVGE